MKYRHILIVILPFLFWYCQTPYQKEINKKLVTVDSLIEEDAQVAEDSLSPIQLEDLDNENRAYYHLLNSIIGSKLNYEFINDSAISSQTEPEFPTGG
jgi:hypothetical protein